MALSRRSRSLALATTVISIACGGGGGSGPGPTPTQIAKAPTNDGDNQVGPAGQPLAMPLAVIVTDASGNPVAGVTITWATGAGSGSIAALGGSNANGIATATWTVGANAGAQTATASKTGLTGSPITFHATAQIQGATQMAQNGGDGQIGPAAGALPTAISIIARDQNGAPVQGVTIAWAAANGGSLNPVTSSSDGSGIASTKWTLGPNAGNQTATGTKTGLAGSPVTFHAVAQIQGATQLAMAPISGNGQTDTVLATLPNPYQVIAKDQDGIPVQGVVVQWAATAGGGSVSAPTSTTDVNGIAVITHTFGSTSGGQSAQASVTGLIGSPVTFTSTALPGFPTQIAKNGGDNQTGVVGTTLPTPHSVIVHDSHGNVVPMVPVAWVVGVGGGSVNPTNSQTGSNGVASTMRTLGPAAGTQTDTAKTALSLSGSPVAFSATARLPAIINVSVNNNFFSPQSVMAAVGDTVRWTWAAGAVDHNVTFQDGPASATQATGTYDRVFTATGTYRYRCTIHSANFTSGMFGTVTVQ